MIPPETSDFAPISVGIAALNRRLNEDDALSGNMAAGGRGHDDDSQRVAGCLPAAPTATRYILIHKPL